MQGSSSEKTSGSGAKIWTIMLAGCVIPLLLLLCCIVGVVGVYVVSPQTLEPVLAVLGFTAKAQAAQFAPDKAPLFFAMDVELKQAVNFQRTWGLYEKNVQAQTSLENFRKEFRNTFSCDFDADVASWWGPDAALFLTDEANLNLQTTSTPRGGTTPTPTPNAVFALGARDTAKAQAALAKCVRKQTVKGDETYKGNKVTLYSDGSAAAVVSKYVLVATTPTALHTAIDAQRGDVKSLANHDAYKAMIARLPASRVATLYVQFAPWLTAASRMQTGVQPQSLAQLEAYKGAGMSLAFEPNGARMDFVATFDPAKLPQCQQQLLTQMVNPNAALKATPANAYLYSGGANLKSVWDCALTQLDATAKKQMDDTFASLNKQMGVDVNADVLSWMTGEYALAVTPAQPISRGVPGVGILAMIEAKDQALINSKMTKIVGALGKQGLVAKDQNVQGVPMKVIALGATTAPGTPAAGYGIVGNWFVLGGPLDALSAAVDAPKSPLANDATFLAVQKILPAKNAGYGYANVTAIEKIIAETLTGTERTNYLKDGQPWLKPIKAMGWATETGKADSVAGTFFLYMPGE